ncbi:hypothetical protein [Klebsiella sp. BIGb0407]|uniref:hypothetical protein n=1 Tax=Klebsiella sp. BIGb0407 TaxID=2940603 RepID=UPI0021673BA0|nr:hypothetical protein [Klebsiella sp. BIGb0407]MCS3432392.1 hypothetical protein [Klebsiella sp. BIGb0407]
MFKVIINILFFTSFFISSVGMANSNGMITFSGAIVEGGCEVTQSGNKLTGNCSGTDNPEKLVNYKNINKMGIRKPHPLPEDKGYMYIDSIDKKNKIAFLHVIYK